ESPPVDRRNFVKRRAGAAPFAIENTRVVVGETQFFQRCFHMKRLNASTASFVSLPTELAHQLHRFINRFRSDIQRRTKSNRILAGAKSQHTKVEEAVPKFFARFRIGKIEREKYSAAACGGNQRLFGLQIAQLIEEIGTYFRGVLNQTFLLDDAQIMGRAHHVGEVSAPS